MENDADVLILGAGAAGLMCAIEAGRRGRRVRVLEHAERIGKKILMSGGGRCNFTNLHTTPAQYLSANPHFCKSALARFTPADFVALVEQHGIAYHEKEAGQLFCDLSSKQIVKMLADECSAAGVVIETGCTIDMVTRDASGRFRLRTSTGARDAGTLVVATGGLSIPKMGATGFGHALARQFGLAVRPTRAGLVPLTLGGRPLEQLADLAGVATPVEARCDDTSFRGPMLFTHRGLSGPALLQISSYWQPGAPLVLNLLPGSEAIERLRDLRQRMPAAELRTALAELLPRRLAQRLCELHFGGSPPLRQIGERALNDIAATLASWTLAPSGTEGYRTAEVTLGGVDTDALSSTTMAARQVPNLYFIGEVVDVTGWLGGYNFQWAWASGVAAGRAV